MLYLHALPAWEAVRIYAEIYAPPIWYHLLAPGVGHVLLDSAANNGVGGAIGIAQTGLGLDVDHTVGPVTLWALTHRPRDALIDLLCDARLKAQKGFKLYAVDIPKHPGRTWGQVWTERIARIRTEAHALAKGTSA